MQNKTTDNIIWPLLIEIVFIAILLVEVILGFLSNHLLGANNVGSVLVRFESIISSIRMFGAFPAGVIGIIYAKETGKWRSITMVTSIVNLVAGYMFVLLIFIMFLGLTGQIHV